MSRAGRVAVGLGLSWTLFASSGFAQTPAPPAPPEPTGTWTGSAGAGVAITSGNSDTTNYNLAFDVTRTPKARNVLKWTGLYLRGDQNDAVVVNRASLGFRDQYALSPRSFLFGQIDYLHDTFKRIDYLIAPTAGAGYKVVETDGVKFAVDAGAGTISEKNPGLDLRTSAAITAGETLVVKVTPTATFKHAATSLWKATDFSDGLYTVSAGLATKISERLQLTIDVLDSFKNHPPTAATKKNDVALVTALSAKF